MNVGLKKTKKEMGNILNWTVISIGIILVLSGVVIQIYISEHEFLYTVLYSVGTSLIASGIVLIFQSRYLVASNELDAWISTWRVLDMYETKSQMNERAANIALQNCVRCIDIIAEGMSGYINVKGSILRDKISQGVKVRIISCDSSELLKYRARDESTTGGDENVEAEIIKIKNLVNWVMETKRQRKKGDIEIRFHSSYPGFSYLRIDSKVFISPNLWRKTSQNSFAIGFMNDGKGGKYFSDYFEQLWEDRSFLHDQCMIS